MKKLLLTLILLTACYRDPPEVIAIKKQQAAAKEQSLSYWKDTRTNLCFAYAWAGGERIWGGNGETGGLVLTTVPCSPEVERLLTFAPEAMHKAD